MDYPRQVTALNGKVRWQASDGQTYDSYTEAEEASLGAEDDWPAPPPSEPPPKPEWSRAFFYLGLGLLLGGGSAYGFFTGELNFKYEWMTYAVPFVCFILAGFAAQGFYDLYLLITDQQPEGYNPEAAFEWWTGKLGCGLILAALGLVVLVVAWSGLQEMFEGVSKGTGMIIVLLFLILIALNNRR